MHTFLSRVVMAGTVELSAGSPFPPRIVSQVRVLQVQII